MLLRDVLMISAALAAFCVMFVLGFTVGYSLRQLRNLLVDLRHDFDDRKEIEDTDTAVIDSSPQHLREKREERIRKGEELDDEDSQIISTKTPQQLEAETERAKESKLDKWMPGVKRGK
jgi:hypothetical protein